MPYIDSRTVDDPRDFGDTEDERTDTQRDSDSLDATAPEEDDMIRCDGCSCEMPSFVSVPYDRHGPIEARNGEERGNPTGWMCPRCADLYGI